MELDEFQYADFLHPKYEGDDIARTVADDGFLPRWYSCWLVSGCTVMWNFEDEVWPDGELNADLLDEDDKWFFDAACMERIVAEKVASGERPVIGYWAYHSSANDAEFFNGGVRCACGCGKYLVQPTIKTAYCQNCFETVGACVANGHDREEDAYLEAAWEAHQGSCEYPDDGDGWRIDWTVLDHMEAMHPEVEIAWYVAA